jgi:REP element-mobilizing transposase RayT
MDFSRKIYTPHNCAKAYQLNWSVAVFWKTPAVEPQQWLENLKHHVEQDGVRILEHRLTSDQTSQFLVSTKPHVSPVSIVRSIKGRLQYLISGGHCKLFQKHYSITSVGRPRRDTIERYVAQQLDRHRMADERTQEIFREFQIISHDVDLSQPRFGAHCRYIYNLHLVFVNRHRDSIVTEHGLANIREGILHVADTHNHSISQASLVSDHTHISLGCQAALSPEEVALAYMNEICMSLGGIDVYQYGYYAGTFGEYDLGAIWNSLSSCQ